MKFALKAWVNKAITCPQLLLLFMLCCMNAEALKLRAIELTWLAADWDRTILQSPWELHSVDAVYVCCCTSGHGGAVTAALYSTSVVTTRLCGVTVRTTINTPTAMRHWWDACTHAQTCECTYFFPAYIMHGLLSSSPFGFFPLPVSAFPFVSHNTLFPLTWPSCSEPSLLSYWSPPVLFFLVLSCPLCHSSVCIR